MASKDVFISELLFVKFIIINYLFVLTCISIQVNTNNKYYKQIISLFWGQVNACNWTTKNYTINVAGKCKALSTQSENREIRKKN